MPKPVILLVDDEPHVLNAVDRDLRRNYAERYRMVKAASGTEALELVKRMKQRNQPVALFLVDQRMPVMTGTEFLQQAIPFYPDARKVLLTAYADTQAAITSINSIGLDYYLIKPWDPPEQHLYPVLDELLAEWERKTEPLYEGIQVAGTMWSAGSHAVKDFLSRNLIPYRWLDIEKDMQARALVEASNNGDHRLPLIFLPEGKVLVAPTIRELAEQIGMQTSATQPFYDLIIIGAGPAGLAAAVYGGSEGLKTVVIEREVTGGQAGTSSRIENYLGFPNGISGAELARRAVTQAKRFGVEILTAEEVVGLRVEDPYRTVLLSGGGQISSHAVMISTGVSVRRLDAPGVERLTDLGIYYGAAISEAAYYRGEDVVVVGGANSAGQGAVFLAQYARSVTILVRSSSLEMGMSQYLVDQIDSIPNIHVLTNAEVTSVEGENHLERICVADRQTGQEQTLEASAMFIFIGAVPHTDIFRGLLEMDKAGFILTGPDLMMNGESPKNWRLKRDPFLLETSIPGVFAAGDVRHHSIKRVASAVGEGAVTVQLIHQYRKTV